MNKVLGLILARGGSKGIPQKNLQPVGGKSLIQRCAEQATASRLYKVCVYSDSDDILSEALGGGANPIRRPEEVSGDKITSEATVQRFLADADASGESDVMLIQCTTPFLRTEHINLALDMYAEGTWDSVVGTTPMPRYLGYTNDGRRWLPVYPYRFLRQDQRCQFYVESGGFYLAKRALWLEGRRMGEMVGMVVMKEWDSIEIDDPEDLDVVRRIAESRL
jgi:CMP-N-acetylneuraminic acid synthetase